MPDEKKTDTPSLAGWYHYASQQQWTIGAYLRKVRDHEFKTREQQQAEFGIDEQDFQRLQAMPLPRKTSFIADARRIAEACHIDEPLIFIKVLYQGLQLTTNSSHDSHPENLASQNIKQTLEPEKG